MYIVLTLQQQKQPSANWKMFSFYHIYEFSSQQLNVYYSMSGISEFDVYKNVEDIFMELFVYLLNIFCLDHSMIILIAFNFVTLLFKIICTVDSRLLLDVPSFWKVVLENKFSKNCLIFLEFKVFLDFWTISF